MRVGRLCWVLLGLGVLGGPATALGQGVGYRYEMHDASFFGAGLQKDAEAPFAVHRLSLVDTSGALAAGLLSFMSARDVGGGTDASGRDYRTFAFEAHPIVPGARVALEFAFEGPTDLDVEVDGRPVDMDSEFDYFELRLNLGGADTLGDLMYVVVDVLDFVMRDVSGRAGGAQLRNDQYALYSGLELGLLLPVARLGGYARYDWVRGLGRALALGDEDLAAHTYDLGVVGALGAGAFELGARWGVYQWSGTTADLGQPNRVEGTMFSLGAQAGF